MSSLFNWNQLDRQAKLGLISILVIAISLPLAIVLNYRQTQLGSEARNLPTPIQIGDDGKPIKISKEVGRSSDQCVVTGCSSELCVNREDAPVHSTCEWKAEYACYRSASCKVQSNGECGWTMDQELRSCLDNTLGIGGNVNTDTATNNQTQTQQTEPSQFTCDRSCPDDTLLTDNCTCEPLDTNAICGNNICESGEADITKCPRCEPGQRCPLAPCIITQGTCPRDCNDDGSTQPPTPPPTNPPSPTPQPTPVQTSPPTNPPAISGDACLNTGGQYRQFRDSCADQCNAGQNCLQVLTTACDCGPDSCFNGVECVTTDTSKPVTQQTIGTPIQQNPTQTTTPNFQPPVERPRTQENIPARDTSTPNIQDLSITTNNLSSGLVNRPYHSLVIATSGVDSGQQISFDISNLPTGLTAQPTCTSMSSFNRNRQIYRCTIEGTPTQSGTHNLTVTVSDPQGNSASKELSLTIRDRQSNLFDALRNFWSGLFN